jgi:hypothetical protein
LLGIKTLDSFNEAGLVQPRILKPAPYGTGFKIVFGYALGFKFIALKVSENSQQSLNFRKLGSLNRRIDSQESVLLFLCLRFPSLKSELSEK